ncbi:hypothetical protein DITRI_Ditri10aG0124400 [Diplodiscus trichospermus]
MFINLKLLSRTGQLEAWILRVFPKSGYFANDIANQLKHIEVALFCNLQLTKDGNGICLADIKLDKSTNIEVVFPKDFKTYNVNGQRVRGWFSVDFTSDVMVNNITLVQNVMSRPNAFDDLLPVTTVGDVVGIRPSVFWLNVQYDTFYTKHKLSVFGYLENAMKVLRIDLNPQPTNQKYSAILKDLSAIKQFASGILVPKGYIWPVDANKYLGNPTTLVAEAHKLGLEVYTYGFANDMPIFPLQHQTPLVSLLNAVIL